MRTFDAPLIDHLFQPIYDRFAYVGSCFILSLMLVDAAIIALTADILLNRQWYNRMIPLDVVLRIAMIIAIFFSRRGIVRAQSFYLKFRDNPTRTIFCPLRIVSVLISLDFALRADWHFLHQTYHAGIIGVIGYGLWISGLYIASCRSAD